MALYAAGKQAAFTASGDPVDPEAEIALTIMLEDLTWWAKVMRQARDAGAPAPALVRRRAAAARAAAG